MWGKRVGGASTTNKVIGFKAKETPMTMNFHTTPPRNPLQNI